MLFFILQADLYSIIFKKQKMSSDKIAKENIVRLNTAISFIEDHLSEKLSLEIVAEKAHFSPFHFHRLLWEKL